MPDHLLFYGQRSMVLNQAGEAQGGSIEALPPRRTLWQWLLRKPRSSYRSKTG
jgi:hypothetical protein